MSFKTRAHALALVASMAVPAQAWAYGAGGAGCSDLPEYYRAVGALQGLSSCDISVEDARRIVAAHQGQAYEQVAPDRPALSRRHRVREPQP